MHLIAGLGNIGLRFEHTRHNVGFDVVNELAGRFGVKIKKIKFQGFYASVTVESAETLLVRPATYMNLSGVCVAAYARYYKIPPENILIVYDDMALPVAKLRLRAAGSDGGHNGIKDIIRAMGTNEIPRLRLGIGKPEADGKDHVLTRFQDEEIFLMKDAFSAAADACEVFVKEGIQAAMNRFNVNMNGDK